jgi:hypothetical protein
LRIAQWRLALARQESQINPGHLEAENSRSHPEHRMAGSLYGSRIARQLDPGDTLRTVRPFVKGVGEIAASLAATQALHKACVVGFICEG